MSIDVKIKDINTKKIDFPKLMKRKETGLVVLFKLLGVGTVIAQGNESTPIGYQGTCFYMDYFTDFEGSVTLSNKV